MGKKFSTDDLLPPDPGRKYRINLTLPEPVALSLRRLSEHMGISQSALVAALLSEALPNLEKLFSSVPSDSDPSSLKRFRGQSIDLILSQVGKALKDL